MNTRLLKSSELSGRSDAPTYYITDMKLMKGELKRGQKAALVINLYYEEERRKAKDRMSEGGKGGLEGTPDLEGLSGEAADILAKKAKGSQGTRTDIVPDLEQSINGRANEALATKSGVGKSNIAYLIAVKKKKQKVSYFPLFYFFIFFYYFLVLLAIHIFWFVQQLF